MSSHEKLFDRFIDDGLGSGVRSASADFNEQRAYSSNDGRSKTRTTFDPSDADTPWKQRRYERLARINDGQWEPDRGTQNHHAEKKRDARLFCDRLEMSSYETDRVCYIVERLDMSQMGSNNKLEKVILAVCSLVRDEEATSLDQRLINDETFEQLMSTVDMDHSDYRTCRKSVKQRSSFFDE